MMEVSFHPEARAELLAAVEYYEEQAPGLGGHLVDEVERAVEFVAGQPELGSPLDKSRGLRRWMLRRFPYYLIYRVEESTALVLALAHQRRRPGYWRAR